MTTRWDVERALFVSDLSPQERLIALTLLAMSDAKNAIVPAQYTPSLSRLQLMTGLSLATVKRALNVLEERGWVVRRRPDPVKARVEKERTCYRLKVPEAGLTESLAGLTESLGLGSQRATGLGSQRATSQTAYQTNSQQQQEASPEAFVQEAIGATAEEAAAIVKHIRSERDVQNMGGFLQRLARDGDLRHLLIKQRASVIRADDVADRKLSQGMPRCEHGRAGGDQPHSVNGELRCVQCRQKDAFQQLNGRAS